MSSNDIILKMSCIDKRFPGVHALKSCDFELRRGEIHALMGENGAGKSTMMKILTGIYQRDSGDILFNGQSMDFHNPKQSQEAGISIVHQELNLMNHLTVAQNVFIGRESKGFWLDDNGINAKVKKLFDQLKLNINPSEKVGNLTVGKQQLVEIVKAISLDASVLVLDEPTAALTETEIAELFKIMRDLKKKGVSMIYISHRMEEIKQISDRVTVMRDGESIGTANSAEISMDEIINMMVGRTIYEAPKTSSNVKKGAPIALEVKELTSSMVDHVSFTLRKGEILGFAGLMGAGRTEVARLVFGADKMLGGEILINGKNVKINHPYDAVQAGIGYLSEDRKRYGLAVGLSVIDNSLLACLKDYSRAGFIDARKGKAITEEYIDKINIKTPSAIQLVKNLSGGNQQKVVIAKWLIKYSDVLIFDEPTRGIDVGAKSEIYKLMNELASEGKAIIMISSELPELLRMSDRIAVMCEGRLTKMMEIQEATQENIMKYATTRN